MEIILLIAAIAAIVFGIRWAIGFVRATTHETGHYFMSMPFWIIVASLVAAIYVGFNVTPEYWVAVTVFGGIGIAAALNIKAIGVPKGLIFTALQAVSIYFAIIVWILYSVFKGAKGSGWKFD